MKNALVMEKEFTLGWLKALNVKLAGLANNHALDGGEAGSPEQQSACRLRESRRCATAR